jgi:membrane-associated phospholipid phosphatase
MTDAAARRRADEGGNLKLQLDEIARPALRLAVLVPLFTAAMTVLGLLVVHGPAGWLREADLRAVETLVDRRSSTLDTLTRYGTWLADTVPVLVLTAVAVLLAWRITHRLVLPAVIALAVGGEKLIYLVTSILVARDRPPVPTLGDPHATASFPSGHVGAALALYGSVALVVAVRAAGGRWRAGLLVVAGILTAVVAFCRVYRGFHFPTDVLAGALLGAVWLWTVWRVLVVTARRATRAEAPTPDG